MRRILAAALPLCAIATSLIALSLMPAEARPRGARLALQHSAERIVCDDRGCSDRGSVASRGPRGASRTVVADLPSRTVGGRPAGCPSRWCGCWLGRHLGMTDRGLWLARNWARVGSPAAGPAPGVIAVWRHHVGKVTAVPRAGIIVLLSGNDGRAVRERARSSAGVIAWRHVS